MSEPVSEPVSDSASEPTSPEKPRSLTSDQLNMIERDLFMAVVDRILQQSAILAAEIGQVGRRQGVRNYDEALQALLLATSEPNMTFTELRVEFVVALYVIGTLGFRSDFNKKAKPGV